MNESVSFEALKENAKSLFINNPKIENLIGLSDGQFFDASSSSASSARQYARENNLDVFPFGRDILEKQVEEPKTEDNSKVKLDKLKLAELQSMATELGILYEPDATKAKIIELIETHNLDAQKAGE